MSVLVQHLALALSAGALAGAAFRLASLAAPGGLERVVATAVLAAAAAGLEAMILGLAAIGTSPVALPLAAVATYTAARAWLADPELGLRDEVGVAWRAFPLYGRLLIGAGAGFVLAWLAWNFRYPFLGEDGLKYHFAQVVAWVHDGSPGARVPVDTTVPFEAYPLTNEVLLSWVAGISRSWMAATLWNPAMLLLAGLATWVGLRAVDAPRLVAGLGAAAILVLPLCLGQLNGPPNDVPALAWMACTGALALASHRRPGLLPIAVVAAGLAIGTKTTTTTLSLIVLGVAAWQVRDRLRRLARPLGGALAAAVVLGGVWYLRNLVDHGSPLWPFLEGPFGDERPQIYADLDASFLSHPGEMLDDGRLEDYGRTLSGGWLLLGAAALTPLLVRSRAVLGAAAAVLLAFFMWMNAPYTGIDRAPGPGVDPDVLALAALRYLLPALTAALLALGLVAAHGSVRARKTVVWALAIAVTISLNRSSDLGFPLTPSILTPAIGAAAGAALAFGLSLLTTREARRRFASPALAGFGVLVAGGAMAVASVGYVERHADTQLFDDHVVDLLSTRLEYTETDREVLTALTSPATLAGNELEHRIRVLGSDYSDCAALERRRRGSWLVTPGRLKGVGRLRRCLRGEIYALDDGALRAYAPLETLGPPPQRVRDNPARSAAGVPSGRLAYPEASRWPVSR